MERKMDDVSTSPASLVGVLLFLIALNCIIIFQDCYLTFWYLLQVFIDILRKFWTDSRIKLAKFSTKKPFLVKNTHKQPKKAETAETQKSKAGDEKLCIREVTMVIENLGNLSDPDEIDSALFEEEPSAGEVREAFGLFDENGDGFIEAKELLKVLCTLGFTEASESDCGRMIGAYDNDGDGRINLTEFGELLERSFR